MTGPAEVVRRLAYATGQHDIEGIVACFAEDYANETPVHPLRNFRGRGQVRRNWEQILTGVPDVVVHIERSSAAETPSGPSGT